MKYILFFLVLAASIASFITFIIPQYQEVKKTQSDIASYSKRLSTAQELQTSRDTLIAKYNGISKVDLDNIKVLLPDSVDNIRLIIQLDTLATKHGMSSLRSISYDTTQKVDTSLRPDQTTTRPYGEFFISFDTSGRYQSFLSFIDELEKNLRLIDIVSVDFTVSDTPGERPEFATMKYRITLKTYWLKQ